MGICARNQAARAGEAARGGTSHVRDGELGMNPATLLYLRKQAARPVYWAGWRLIRLADKLDGKQPRKPN